MSARVLVVDDDPTVAEVVTDYLRAAGLEPRHAADGQSALSLAEEWPPDLVVLDLMLPGIDGLEVCRRLRLARDGQNPVPVIMLTALGQESDRVLGLQTGADDYVTKPFSPRELTLRVQAVLRRAGQAEAGVTGVALPPQHRRCPQMLLADVPGAVFIPVAGVRARPAFVWLPVGRGSCAMAVRILDGSLSGTASALSRQPSSTGGSA
jgi:DNA-binding response OmpR family regulator